MSSHLCSCAIIMDLSTHPKLVVHAFKQLRFGLFDFQESVAIRLTTEHRTEQPVM